jgi:hypothetical protein
MGSAAATTHARRDCGALLEDPWAAFAELGNVRIGILLSGLCKNPGVLVGPNHDRVLFVGGGQANLEALFYELGTGIRVIVGGVLRCA